MKITDSISENLTDTDLKNIVERVKKFMSIHSLNLNQLKKLLVFY